MHHRRLVPGLVKHLEHFLGILKEDETVFDPASCYLGSLLPELIPTLALDLTWKTEETFRSIHGFLNLKRTIETVDKLVTVFEFKQIGS